MTRTVEIVFRILREGAEFSRLYPVEGSSPTLTFNSASNIKMSLRGEFVEPDPSVDLLTDRIQPVLIIDGEEHTLGILLTASVQDIVTDTGKHISIEAYDQCWLLQTSMSEETLGFLATYTYTNSVKNMLDRAGIGIRRIADSSIAFGRLRTDWLPGSSYLQVINDLLDEINYTHLWFDLNGYAIAGPKPDPNEDPIRHILSEQDIHSLLIRDMRASSDFYSTPNVFIYYSSNADKASLRAVAINNDLQSPLSVPRRGRKIISVTRVNDVPNQTTLQAMADYALNSSRLQTESLTVKTGLLPDFNIGDIVALEINGEMSICVEKSWTMNFVPGGIMTHKMERTVPTYG